MAPAPEGPGGRVISLLWRALSWPFWLALVGGCTAVLLAFSLDWGLAQHAPPRLVIANEILRGAAPYREVIDLNAPGVLLIHAAALLVFGVGDAAWRAFDLCYLLATDLAAAAVGASVGWPAAILAAILITALHLATGPTGAGDPEFLVVLPMMVGVAGVLWGLRRQRLSLLFLGGLAAGTAATVKLSAIAFPLFLLLILIWPLARTGRLAPGLGSFVAGALIVPGIILVWLLRVDALSAYVAAVRELMPVFDAVMRLSIAWELVRLAKGSWPVLLPFAPILIWIVGAPVLARAHLKAMPVLLCLAGLAAGVVMLAVYPKDFEYFLTAILAFALVLAALGFGALVAAGPVAQRIAAIGVIAVVAITGPRMIDRYRHEAAIWPRNPVRAPLMEDLARLVPGDARVQVLEDFLVVNDAMLHQGRRPPTSFVYDYFLFMHPKLPLTQRLRVRLLDEMARQPPAAIVVAHFPWWDYDSGTPGFRRLTSWPELEALLARDYRLEVERMGFAYQGGSGYRIYLRQGG